MKERPEKKVHRGVEIWVNPTIEKLRVEENMCAHCRGMFDTCGMLEKLAECFKDEAVLMMVYGCPYFESSEGKQE